MICIGIAGPEGAGKHTLGQYIAEAIERQGGRVFYQSFAQPCENIARVMGWDGEKDAKGKRLLQLLSNSLRKYIDADVWVQRWAEMVDYYALQVSDDSAAHFAIADDVRYENEAREIRRRGHLLHVKRMGYFYDRSHVSDGGVVYDMRDKIVHNYHTVEHLRKQAAEIVYCMGFFI